MSAAQEELSFVYFPENYRWSHGLLIGLNTAPWGGAEIGEINRIGLRLKGHVGDDDAWFREWAREGRTLEDRGRALIAQGRGKSGAQYLQRASIYYHVGERFLQPKSKAGNDAYMRGVNCLRDAAKFIKRPKLEHVEIPYGDTSLPAIYVHAEPVKAGGKVPAMVFFDGLDVTKEIQYFKGVADLAARGIACLIVDGPGNGESIRFRNLYLRHDTEHYATPVYEYLAARPEVDDKRVGVMAISLGGYYAPRAASMEPRFACCIAWGAQWDYQRIWRDRFERLARADTPSLSVAAQHICWVFNAASQDDALKRLEPFKLDGVVQKMTCPFLMLHGEGDEQIPLPEAQKCFDAVGSKTKVMKVFTRDEGGYHHCQIDNQSICSAYMWDWLEETLQPAR
ncbi:MAG TPA: alpha/beta fold hydrolase [Pseudolabrys sp.]|jgi:alpha-beta hydrolase superfamily lysophospholipase|nr:alpha/beta fold hydrolase [Pseudolabrys sp.]